MTNGLFVFQLRLQEQFSEMPYIFSAFVAILFIANVISSAIVCTALSYNEVRVTWTDEENKNLDEKLLAYYVVSWFSVEELNSIAESPMFDFRNSVDYDYESEILRYNDDTSYEEILEDIAASISLSSLNYATVKETNFYEIKNGLISNHTLDVAVRAVFKSINQRPLTGSRDGEPLLCRVEIPPLKSPFSTEVRSTSSTTFQSTSFELESKWMWFVISPGVFFGATLAIIGFTLFRRKCQKLRSKSKVGLIAASWEAVSNNGGRHWVVPQRCWSPSSDEGRSMDYTSSSLVSGRNEEWNQVHFRYPLATVEEEESCEESEPEISPLHAVVNRQPTFYYQRRMPTPQVPGMTSNRSWGLPFNPSRFSNTGSTSLWKNDDDAVEKTQDRKESKVVTHEPRGQAIPSFYRQKSEFMSPMVNKNINLLHRGFQDFSDVSVIPAYSSSKDHPALLPRKRRLRATKSSINVL